MATNPIMQTRGSETAGDAETGLTIFDELAESIDADAPEGELSPPDEAGAGEEDGEKPQAAAETAEGEGEEKPAPPAGFVDKRALSQARMQHRKEVKELQQELAKERETRARFDERLKTIQELEAQAAQRRAAEAAQGAEQPPPDPNEDPLGHALWRADRAERMAMETRQQVEQWGQSATQARAVQDFQTRIAAEEQRFRVDHPDYDQAVQHLAAQRHRFYTEQGISPQAAQELVAQEATAVADRAFQSGANPAQVFYAMAGQWAGYPGASPPPAPEPAPQPEPEAAPATETVTNAQRLEAQRRGRAVSGLGGASSANAPEDLARLSAEALANMSEDEFLEHYNDPESRKLVLRALEAAEGIR